MGEMATYTGLPQPLDTLRKKAVTVS